MVDRHYGGAVEADLWALFQFDLYRDVFAQKRSPRLAEKLMNRLYREDKSEFRSLVFDEMNNLPDDDEEKEKTLDKLRYVAWSYASEQRAGMLDMLSAININTRVIAGDDDPPEWSMSYRPDLPDGATNTKTSSDHTVLGEDFNFKDIASVLRSSGMTPS